ncbi:hypothetical protein [Arcobacter cloacae]|uniref:Uncharacterized protein n=1 Tax=Arcobacter cloacae TaxID=1054034 RepID=A0A6M8NJQ1_9BACT|nr:hypothetical protein [Arcobacter cloacae]QKF90729.1 hypothetical protein ACLO_2272 [Arcobacter cloacae]RXI41510.1 hypothetical protein CP963_06995 [Arcobacter cloacae]
MEKISQIWHDECLKTGNFMMILTSTMLKNYQKMEFYRFSEIKSKERKLNNEIIDFITAFGGLVKTYNFFSNAYIIKDKHIICIYRYCNRFQVQPHRLRMSTDFTIHKTPIVYDLSVYNSAKVA